MQFNGVSFWHCRCANSCWCSVLLLHLLPLLQLVSPAAAAAAIVACAAGGPVGGLQYLAFGLCSGGGGFPLEGVCWTAPLARD